MIKNNFAIALNKKMKEKNISKAELARQIDVSDTTISRYTNGEVIKPKKIILNRIADILGCSVDEIYQL